MRLHVKVVPRASSAGLAGWMGAVLKARVAAPPERGAANAALVRLLTDALGVPQERVRLVAGASAERKVIEIDGLTQREVHRRVERALEREAMRRRP